VKTVVEPSGPRSPCLCGLAANPALPADLLDRLIADADGDVLLELTDRDDLSPSQAGMLAARGGTSVAVQLARRGLIGAAGVDPTEPLVALALLDLGRAPESWARALAGHS
jgi:hypothetical protein